LGVSLWARDGRAVWKFFSGKSGEQFGRVIDHEPAQGVLAGLLLAVEGQDLGHQ
jgi:hypothetical protein